MSEVEFLSQRRPVGFVSGWYQTATADQFWMRKRFDFLREAFSLAGLRSDAPLRALDIGSGNGVVRAQIEQSTSWTVDCADIDADALAQLPSGRGRNLFYDITERHESLREKYDVLLLLDVVEHIEQPVPFLEAALAHLARGGHVVINVPALQTLFSRYDVSAGHFRRYSRRSLNAELRNLPLEARVVRYWGATMVPLLAARKLAVSRMQNDAEVIKLGFDPGAKWIDFVLGATLELERRLLPVRPIGTSLIYIGQKR